jgi:hypothetical protein
VIFTKYAEPQLYAHEKCHKYVVTSHTGYCYCPAEVTSIRGVVRFFVYCPSGLLQTIYRHGPKHRLDASINSFYSAAIRIELDSFFRP